MLRASIEISGKTADVSAITGAENAETDGVPSAAALVCFAEAAVGGTDAELSLSRARVVRELGAEALVDAAAVVGNFQRMVRIADATGIPLDAPVAAMTAELRDELSLNTYSSARNTPPTSWLARRAGALLAPVAIAGLRLVSAIQRRRERTQ